MDERRTTPLATSLVAKVKIRLPIMAVPNPSYEPSCHTKSAAKLVQETVVFGNKNKDGGIKITGLWRK
jgi:hypothetical protein